MGKEYMKSRCSGEEEMVRKMERERQRDSLCVSHVVGAPSLLITKTTHSFETEPAEEDYTALQTSDSFQHLFINSYCVD